MLSHACCSTCCLLRRVDREERCGGGLTREASAAAWAERGHHVVLIASANTPSTTRWPLFFLLAKLKAMRAQRCPNFNLAKERPRAMVLSRLSTVPLLWCCHQIQATNTGQIPCKYPAPNTEHKCHSHCWSFFHLAVCPPATNMDQIQIFILGEFSLRSFLLFVKEAGGKAWVDD